MRLNFVKYQGLGNDFILIDQRSNASFFSKLLIQRLCHRQKGIGADGLILLSDSKIADYRMCIFNADGSEPTMCGNGLRCLFSFVQSLGETRPSLQIETKAGIFFCQKKDDAVAVNLGVPKVLYWPIDLSEGKLFVLNTGVPHAVLFVDPIEKIAVEDVGRKIRFHPQFAPDGVNVNFVSMTSFDSLKVRTYERGVEKETLSCGTGSAAAAYVASQILGLPSPVLVSSFANPEDHMRFQFLLNDNGSYEIEMLGRTEAVFQGEFCC